MIDGALNHPFLKRMKNDIISDNLWLIIVLITWSLNTVAVTAGLMQLVSDMKPQNALKMDLCLIQTWFYEVSICSMLFPLYYFCCWCFNYWPIHYIFFNIKCVCEPSKESIHILLFPKYICLCFIYCICKFKYIASHWPEIIKSNHAIC